MQLSGELNLDPSWVEVDDIGLDLAACQADFTSPFIDPSVIFNGIISLGQLDGSWPAHVPAMEHLMAEKDTFSLFLGSDRDLAPSRITARTMNDAGISNSSDFEAFFDSLENDSNTEVSLEYAASPLGLLATPNEISSPEDLPDLSRRPESTTSTTNFSCEQNISQRRKRSVTNKAAHNQIEKRYRNKLNSQFSALDKALPSPPSLEDPSDNDSKKCKMTRRKLEELQDTNTANRSRNKSQILSTALTYIKHLEYRNAHLRSEVMSFKNTLLPSWKY